MSSDPVEALPWYRTLAGRVAAAVVVLVLAALALFAYNLSALRALEPLAGDSIDELETLQWLFAAGSLGMGGLILVWIRALLDREARAGRGERLRAILDTTSDGIVTIDVRGIILEFNRTAERLFGWKADEIIGKNVSVLAASPHREDHDAYLERYLQTGERRIIGTERQVEGQHRDGTTFPISLRVSEMKVGGGRFFIGIVQDMRTQVERGRLLEATQDVVEELLASASELLATASEQASAAQQQSASVTETVVTVEQVNQTSSQAADRAKNVAESSREVDELGRAGRSSVHSAVQAIEDVKHRGESVAKNVLELAERAQTIGQIIGTVDEIAEQTNLLALNAAIEASRAGEHGRGFSVVAAEIKALARRSKDATVQVREILGEIQKATHTAVLAGEEGDKTMHQAVAEANEAGRTIDGLTDMIGRASDAAGQIAASAGQQATGMAQISQAMKDIDGALRDNLSSIKHVEEAASRLNKLSERLKALLADYDG
ncbi:MAG TPA: methyl-accepting chemotaxis protein [Sandaracinaceae bacterium LLY-WYZ-13_1]|nr:methyl-accepting chemotaxis protein [Sandaracinaceae bacterium LLY-WYZ-13_1]